MAHPSEQYFTKLTELAQASLDSVTFQRLDIKPSRAIWEAHGLFCQYSIRVKEIFNQSGRMYSYYVIKEGQVEVGFDNYPDHRALREKYGPDYKKHLNELIPHKHGYQKKSLELTEEMQVHSFITYIHSVLK